MITCNVIRHQSTSPVSLLLLRFEIVRADKLLVEEGIEPTDRKRNIIIT